jgi:hypothetical protein
VRKFTEIGEDISLILNESFSHSKTKLRMAPEWPMTSSGHVDPEGFDQESINEDDVEMQFTEENKYQLQVYLSWY